MLKGKEFGTAIGEAIALKISQGKAESKAAIARHFNMKPPSLSDWVKKGSVAKDKLPELWRFFSDVVGPDHWGMSADEWPHGLSAKRQPKTTFSISEPTPIAYAHPKSQRDREIEQITNLLKITDERGIAIVLDKAKDIAAQYPVVKKTPASSQ